MQTKRKLAVCAGGLLLAVYWFLTVEITGASPANFLIIRDLTQSANISLVPFRDLADVLGTGDQVNILRQIGGNVLLFAPMGFLVPAFWPGWRKCTRTVGLGLAMSLFIETCQLFTWRASTTDDLILNTLGAACGWLCYRLAACVLPALRERAKRPEWTPVLVMLSVWAAYTLWECWLIGARWVGC